MQDAYLAAYRSIGQFRGESSLGTWLSRLVLNECLMRLRRHARRQNVIPIVGSTADTDLEMDKVTAHEEELPGRVAGHAQLRELLERKLDELPESYRAVFVMRSVEDLSVEEVAACLQNLGSHGPDTAFPGQRSHAGGTRARSGSG